MPQDRILYADTAAWRVERVVKSVGVVGHPHADAHAHLGRPVYQAATSRWVFPVCGVSEFHMAGRQVLLDGLTVVALPTGLPYQIHEWQPAAARSHMVVSMQPGRAPASPPGAANAWTLPPRALWQLRLHWRALARGATQVDDAGSLLPSQGIPDSGKGATTDMPAAVARARRFMATRTAAADGVVWSLHDVADAAHCSYFHLARLFRAHTGLGLHAYREQLRLAMALQRLDEGERDLAALAHDLGYCSQSHLGAQFHRDVGVTPAQARQAFRG